MCVLQVTRGTSPDDDVVSTSSDWHHNGWEIAPEPACDVGDEGGFLFCGAAV